MKVITKIFFINILQNESGLFSSFSRAKFICGNLIFSVFRPLFTVSFFKRGHLIGSLKSQNMIFFIITTGSLNNHDMTRIIKQWRHDFSGKHLRDRYCIYIMWCLCGGQSSLFFKASLRICYVNLFECKGLLMSKTVINFRLWNRRLQNYTEKVPCTALLNYLRTFAFNIFYF